ncbi:MAG: strawberry notch family protein, partial [Bacteroidales bacterium]|nr:strawberry notch family protein [Bacteroidales bacterium]
MKVSVKQTATTTTIKFASSPTCIVVSRLVEMGFKPSKDFKLFVISSSKLEDGFARYVYHLLKAGGCKVLEGEFKGLGMAYVPASEQGTVLNVATPDSMGFEMHVAIRKVKQELKNDLFGFVAKELGYSATALINALSAEQIDAVAMSIYNIQKGQGIIIGDQTGIGKGRIAAAMIRYGVIHKMKPIFLSEKPNLFSDIYRDLADIGSDDLKPFIVNSKEGKTHVKDRNGDIIYSAPEKTDQERILKSQKIPGYDFVMGTYSQFNQPDRKPLKPEFLTKMAQDNLIIMDEAHNASGSSNTGAFMQSAIKSAKGVVFLSATFAKRPDNMPIYAMKTAMSEANMTQTDLVEAIQSGGVALQEVLSSQLVAEGQLMRRERTFEGIEVNYDTLYNLAPEHTAIADNITGILRDIIAFQNKAILPMVEEMDEIVKGEQKEAELRQGTANAGVDSPPYFSKVFNVINQMLFSIKAEAVADRAIERLKEGKKPVIAFASTMGSFLEEMAVPGETINADFSTVLMKGLDTVMRYSVKNEFGESQKEVFNLSEMSPEGQDMYGSIMERIESVSTGITISPIDIVKQKINQAGFSVAEVTGRKLEVQFQKSKKTGNFSTHGLVLNRKKENTNDAFRMFNNNEVDVLMINQSGSTGASAHAIVTDNVPADQVKQRVMIILQAELNINTEVQKRGRINRTGQILLPIYDYVISAIPAEQRLMMMLRKKLKSLDANTTSNQRSSDKVLNVEDFLNKIGDKIVREYLLENKELNEQLGNPLKFEGKDGDDKALEGDANKVTGRVAVLSVKEQDEFYKEINYRYTKQVDYLKSIDEYDLEVDTMNLMAETKNRIMVKLGKGGESAFGEDVHLERAECNVLRKPFKRSEIDILIAEDLQGRDPLEARDELIEKYTQFEQERFAIETDRLNKKWDEIERNITNERKYHKLETDDEKSEYLKKRKDQVEKSKAADIEGLDQKSGHRLANIRQVFKFFTTGMGLKYPSWGSDGDVMSPALFLGFNIDEKRKNPYAPSAIDAKFAVADSRKFIKLALSGDQRNQIDRIISRSANMALWEREEVLKDWDSTIQKSMVNRKSRHIMTGNLLVAAGSYNNGKLVAYTTIDGKEVKGLLMPENWIPDDSAVNDVIRVPVKKVAKYIIGSTQGSEHRFDHGISMFKTPRDSFKILIPKK